MKNFNEYVNDLSRLIAFESTKGEPSDGAPFGEKVARALDYFLGVASRMGFDTVNHDGYMGEITFGEGQEVGVIGHLDVVPVGIGWKTPPFTLTEKDGVYYGRGIADDKGPTLLALYALKALKDSGITPNKKFRLFVGTNEESGWQDVEYYRTIGSFPEYGFSPDGNFPLTYAEKGILEVEFCLPAPKNFSALSGGTALNAVCDFATCIAKDGFLDENLLKKHNLVAKNNLIQSFGKAAHGSSPHLGKNAIKPLLSYLCDMGEDYNRVIERLFDDVYKLGKMVTEQGALTFSPNLLRQENDKIYITCDCRIPYPLTVERVTKLIEQFNIPFKTKERHPPMCAGKDGWFVNTLIGAYNAVTGESAVPVAMGGSTFARAFKYGCSFGADKCDGSCGNYHDANEYITKDQIILCYEIYKRAIFDLAK